MTSKALLMPDFIESFSHQKKNMEEGLITVTNELHS